MGNCMPSKCFKTTDCKIAHLNFSDFFRQSVTKIMGKTAVWTFSCFYPLPHLNNVEKQCAKLALNYVMVWQHCIGGEGESLNTFFKITRIFCH